MVLDAKSLEVQGSFAGTGFDEGPRLITIDNEFFLHASWNGDLMVRRVNTGEVVIRDTNPGCMISDLAMSLDGKLAACLLKEKGDHGSRLLFRRRLPFDQHSTQAPIPINKLRNAHTAVADDGRVVSSPTC